MNEQKFLLDFPPKKNTHWLGVHGARIIFFIAVSACFLLRPFPLRGGVHIKQKIDGNLNGNRFQTTNEWFIDQGKFKLKSVSGQSTTEYFFSGTVFYICGKLTSENIAKINARQVFKGLKESLARGACQVVPSNFLVRFFLSPLASIESIDATDGLQLTLSLSNYHAKKVDKTNVVRTSSCENWDRSYRLKKIKSSNRNTQFAIESQVKESLCLARDAQWRKLLWREVTKSVLVQPGSGALMEELRKDYKMLEGALALQGTVQQTIDLPGQGPQVLTLNLHPVSYVDEKIPAAYFKLPQGVYLFRPETFLNESEVSIDSQRSNNPSPTPSNTMPIPGSPGESIVDFLQSAVFCGLAQGLCLR